jgi:hypothetical protein
MTRDDNLLFAEVSALSYLLGFFQRAAALFVLLAI